MTSTRTLNFPIPNHPTTGHIYRLHSPTHLYPPSHDSPPCCTTLSRQVLNSLAVNFVDPDFCRSRNEGSATIVTIDRIEEDSTHKTQEDVTTRERPGTPGGVRDGDRSRHKRSASIVTKDPQLVMYALIRHYAPNGGAVAPAKIRH